MLTIAERKSSGWERPVMRAVFPDEVTTIGSFLVLKGVPYFTTPWNEELWAVYVDSEHEEFLTNAMKELT